MEANQRKPTAIRNSNDRKQKQFERQLEESREQVSKQLTFSKRQYKKQQLAEQRYEILVKLENIHTLYLQLSTNSTVPTRINLLRDELEVLVIRPTIMKREEVETILKVFTLPHKDSSGNFDFVTMDTELIKVINYLKKKLRPEIFLIYNTVYP